MFAESFFDELEKIAKSSREVLDGRFWRPRKKASQKTVGVIGMPGPVSSPWQPPKETTAVKDLQARMSKSIGLKLPPMPKLEMPKMGVSSCHSAYTPRKPSGKPRAPRRVSPLHSEKTASDLGSVKTAALSQLVRHRGIDPHSRGWNDSTADLERRISECDLSDCRSAKEAGVKLASLPVVKVRGSDPYSSGWNASAVENHRILGEGARG